jgi:hypothetical protein
MSKDSPPVRQMTAMQLLLGELRGVLDDAAYNRVRVVLDSWGAQRVSLLPSRTIRQQWAAEAVKAMIASGAERPAVVQRLRTGHGMSRSKAYRFLRDLEGNG